MNELEQFLTDVIWTIAYVMGFVAIISVAALMGIIH